LKTVQVVGTSGKGTTAVALAGALEAEGMRSGAYPLSSLYTSFLTPKGSCLRVCESQKYELAAIPRENGCLVEPSAAAANPYVADRART